MVNSCSAVGCKNKNTKGTNITFHRFPLNNQHLLKLWLYQIKRGNWEPSKYSVLCSEHFTEDCFVIKGVHNRRTLKNDACPTKFSIASYTESIKKKKVIKEKASDVDMAETSDEGKQGEEQQDSATSKLAEDEEEST
ncbi:THAP domain-containing protein 1 [Parasteatoda tepidariorum]|uniref:THAP domain-containing protein 1 n=1 Tax=Parasteatoda tepidariorum TaxID=114398 RepID=UPI00077F8AA4|nr:THAP domain-containing protein 1 [Parasteatoda tepidariorum]